WPLYSGRDFDRSLTPRGEEEAATTAHAILAAGLAPTRILASSARRTRQTAEILAHVFGLPSERLLLVDALYNAKPAALEAELLRVARPGTISALVAHNPGISDLARTLGGDTHRAPFPPAGWAGFPLRDHAAD
ncbi:MAG: hypothetical protein RL030_1321, partial [Pseudomonadota bacterium]